MGISNYLSAVALGIPTRHFIDKLFFKSPWELRMLNRRHNKIMITTSDYGFERKCDATSRGSKTIQFAKGSTLETSAVVQPLFSLKLEIWPLYTSLMPNFSQLNQQQTNFWSLKKLWFCVGGSTTDFLRLDWITTLNDFWKADISNVISLSSNCELGFGIRSDEWLTLETSAFQIFHGGNSAFINSFHKTNIKVF